MRWKSARVLAEPGPVDWAKRPHPLRQWRTRLSVAVPAVALLWLTAMDLTGNRLAYSSGPVSSAHAFVERRCEVCHVPRGVLRAAATDTACLTCHDAPPHHVNENNPPDCASCHRDHRGRVALAATADAPCVTCHGQLEPVRGPTYVARTVRSFPHSHPEFAAAMPGARDPGTLQFNHRLHLQQNLEGPAGRSRLACDTCHKPELLRISTQRRITSGQMAPITYQQHCAACHPLVFDERIGLQAPHAEPVQVREAVRRALIEYIAARPDESARMEAPAERGVEIAADPPARTPAGWVERRSAGAERHLWQNTCAQCHLLTAPRPTDGLPVVASAFATVDWMPHARFDHTPHAIIECTSCHAADRSSDAADVLMPSGRRCAACHVPGRGAGARCSTCHAYHDWTKAGRVTPVLTLPR